MSTTTPTPYVPYQAYKSKRHSRVISSPPPDVPNGTEAGEQLNRSRHVSASSVDTIPKMNGEAGLNGANNLRDDVARNDNDKDASVRPGPRPVSMIILPQHSATKDKDVYSGSEQTSPSSPGAKSTVSSVAGIRINGEPVDPPYSHSRSQSTTEPSSPSSSHSAPFNSSTVPTSDINGKAKAVAVAFPSEKAAGKAPATPTEAGPSTLASKPIHNPRRSSTFRYVSLRAPPNTANPLSGSSSTPRTSSPLRHASTLEHGHGHNRAASTSGLSPLSSARQLGDQPSPLQAPVGGPVRSPTSVHSDLIPDTAQPSLLKPTFTKINSNMHHRSTSMAVSVSPSQAQARINPPQRTSSLPPAPGPVPPKPMMSAFQPSISPTPSPIPASAVGFSSASTTSSRVQSPIPQSTPTPSTSVSTPTSSTPTTATYKTVYRPGFQPKGVYRPLTDDFLALRKRARDEGRIEQTRLERRFEKLVDLHFTNKSEVDLSEGSSNSNGSSGKEKEKLSGTGTGRRPRPSSGIFDVPTAPALARRASSFFEELGELRGKSPSELWRSVLESRAAAANGGKGDIRTAEQRITPWQDDAEVSACPLCSASFHPLTNRKHHCRLCGRIICSLPVKQPQRPVPCSLLFISDPKTGRIEEVTEGVDYGVKPRVRTTSTVGGGGGIGIGGKEEKYLKGVRICRECKPVMLRQQYLQEAKRVPAMVRLYEALISLESEIEDTLPHFQELMLSLSNNPDEAPTKEASAARKHLLQCFADYDAIAKRIRKIPCPGGPGSSQDRVQAAIQARASMFLQKNMFPLQSLPKPKKRSPTGSVSDKKKDNSKEVVDPDSELARALQPLLEQEALLESFVEEATTHRKFEDAKTLKANLGEIRAEIDRIVASADGQLA